MPALRRTLEVIASRTALHDNALPLHERALVPSTVDAGGTNSVVVHTPNHASWLNQVEVYFSIVQRKVLTPNDFKDLEALKQCLLEFENYYEEIAKPFSWKFTRQDLNQLSHRLAAYEPRLAQAA